MRGVDNDIVGALLVLRDVTGQRRQDDRLRESEERYRVLFEQSQDAMATLAAPSWRFTSANPATLTLFGVKRLDEFLALGLWDISPERQPCGGSSREKAREMIQTALREGSHLFDWTHRRIDGTPIPCSVLLNRMNVGGEVFLQATIRDVTLIKQTQERLRESEQLLRMLVDSIDAGVVVIDVRTQVIEMANARAARMFGAAAEDLIGHVCHRFLCPADMGRCPVIDCGLQVEHADRIMLRGDGSAVPVWKSVRRIQTNGREKLLETFVDISERKHAEEKLRLSEERWQLALRGSNDGVFDWNTATGEWYISDRSKEILGYAPDEVENSKEAWVGVNSRRGPGGRRASVSRIPGTTRRPLREGVPRALPRWGLSLDAGARQGPVGRVWTADPVHGIAHGCHRAAAD